MHQVLLFYQICLVWKVQMSLQMPSSLSLWQNCYQAIVNEGSFLYSTTSSYLYVKTVDNSNYNLFGCVFTWNIEAPKHKKWHENWLIAREIRRIIDKQWKFWHKVRHTSTFLVIHILSKHVKMQIYKLIYLIGLSLVLYLSGIRSLACKNEAKRQKMTILA